jgi:hypothetical protein
MGGISMRKRIVFAALLLLAAPHFVENVAAQEKKPPFTREEIVRRLKPTPGVRSEQADLAVEIAERGVAFPVNDQTLAELRKAGARAFVIEAIQRAADDAARPKSQSPPAPAPPTENTDRPRLRPRPPDEPQIPEPDQAAARAEALKRLPLLEQARYHAAEFMEELPNFIVTQFVTRYVQTPQKKDWQAQDKLEVELSYSAKQGEKFKLLRLNGKPTNQNYEQLGGATSTGEFGSMLAALFSQRSQAEFKKVKRETFRGRQAVIYDFRVKKAHSSNQITDKNTNRTVTVGYQGSVWIEVETARVLRVEQAADDIQPGFPVTLIESAVEYDWVTIAGARYLLPVYAEVIMGRDADRFYTRNVIELRDYRVFDTDLKIIPEKEPGR